jgi:hypothetical protein
MINIISIVFALLKIMMIIFPSVVDNYRFISVAV